jgi:UDP-2,4-diacetamido-2,4,6-trideoxy-beta-L-altropyranose hydrolase
VTSLYHIYQQISSKHKNILFRADSSSAIGLGHIMRDLVLAQKFYSSNITFATRDLEGNINHTIKEHGYTIHNLETSSTSELQEAIEKYHATLLVVDHYDISYDQELEIKKTNPDLTLMVIDDLYSKHHCDILLNHNIYADSNIYKGLVPESCKLLCGSEYTLIRDEFIEAKRSSIKREKNRVLVAIGGSDVANLNPKILEALQEYKLNIDVVTTTANANLYELEQYSKAHTNISLHINSSEMAKLLMRCSFAILTPSVTANEAWYLGTKFIAIKVADNQEMMYQFLKDNGVNSMDTFEKDEFQLIVGEYIEKE